jgi:predicted permease
MRKTILASALIQDLRYAWRTLRNTPIFALTALLTFALGIGASTAIFTVVDSVLLRPLAYRDSGRLVAAWEHVGFLAAGPTGPNPRHFDLWRKRATAFRGFTLLRHYTNGLTLGPEHPHVVATVVSLPDLFDVLEVTPALGRVFRPEDGDVVVITHSLWQTLFHGDPNVIGKTFRLGDVPKEVIGVLPASFHFPNANALRAFHTAQPISGVTEPAVFIPAALHLDQFDWNGEYGNWVALGRLRPGITIREAEVQLNAIEAQVLQEMLASEKNGRFTLAASVQPMQEAVVGASRSILWVLMCAVLGLMLTACLNLANAQIGRALSRRREFAVRAALGASGYRLLWSGLAENLLLAMAGGAVGIAFTLTGIGLLHRYSPIDLPRLAEVRLNRTVLLFAISLTLASSILAGLLPAVRSLRADPQASLQQYSSRTSGSRQSRRLRGWLIGIQVFGCTTLLLITGVFSKSLLYLLYQDKGFETQQVAVAEVRLPPTAYNTDASRTAFDDAVLANLRAIPGVESAGLGSAMPLEGETWIEGIQRLDGPKREALINLRWASPEYFETLKEHLLSGRFLEERDRNLNSIVISESTAKALWRNEDPIGGRVHIQQHDFTVVGVVADSRSTSLKSVPPRMAYLHYVYRTPYTTLFFVRGQRPAEALIPAMRQAIWKYAPDITIARAKTLNSQVTDSLATERLETVVLIAFGAAALLLALLGIYGVLSYSVALRKSEIGLRMALGATRSRIYGLTFSDASAPVFAGLLTGLLSAVLSGRFIRSLLYGTQPLDPSVMAIVTGLFLLLACLAALVPAHRAASVDPMETLRSE